MHILFIQASRESAYPALKLAFEKLNHRVSAIFLDTTSDIEKLKIDILKERPDFCFTVNYYAFDSAHKNSSDFEFFFEQNSIPIVSFYWDAPWVSGSWKHLERLQKGPFSKNTIFLTIDRAHYAFFRQRGMRAEYFPTAVDSNLFNFSASTEFKSKFSLPLVFVGTPHSQLSFQIDSLEEINDSYSRLFLAEFEANAKNILGREIQFSLKTWIEKITLNVQEFFKCSIHTASDYDKHTTIFYNETKMGLPPEAQHVIDLMRGRLDMLYSWWQVHSCLYRLQNSGLSVFGGEEWKKFLLPNLKNESPRLSDDELWACFQNAKISLCMTKWQFRSAVHERPLQILACRGFPLTDYRSDLDELFEPQEIESYKSIEEAQDKIKFYQKNESARLKVIERGSKRVQENHTYDHRAQRILEIIKSKI